METQPTTEGCGPTADKLTDGAASDAALLRDVWAELAHLREELQEERRLRLQLETHLRVLLPSLPLTASATTTTSASPVEVRVSSSEEGTNTTAEATTSSVSPTTQQTQNPSEPSTTSSSLTPSPSLFRKPSFGSSNSLRQGARGNVSDQQLASPRTHEQEQLENLEKRVSSLEEQVWAWARQQAPNAQPAASGLLSNLLGRVEEKSKTKRRTMRGQHQEGDSDDEWVNDLTPQEIAELKERVANRSVHSIVKDGSLSQLRVKVADNTSLINLKDGEGQTPLHVACIEHPAKMDMVRFLLANNADVNAVDSNGWTPLHAACKNGHGNGELIRLLLNAGADPAIANADETRPIHYFARQNITPDQLPSYSKALNLLLSKGADLNATNRHGETALHNTVMYACNEVAVHLLTHKSANLSHRNLYGETVLNYAIRTYKKEIVEKLLDLGMDPRMVDDRANKTALKVAASLGPPGKDIYSLVKARAAALDMKDMTPEQKTRYRLNLAIEEIITTEKEYVEDLRILHSVFLEPLKKNQSDDAQPNKILTKMEMQSIFGNIEQIYQVATNFLSDLPNLEDLDGASDPPAIGKIFLKHMKAFGVYEKVCTHQQVSTEWLDRALGKDEKRGRKDGPTPFADFCDKAKQLKACRKLDLAAFLIKPFQRITKYPLLLREVMSYCSPDTYSDYEHLKEAQEQLNAIINGANEKKRMSDHLQTIIKIQSRIDWPAQTLVNSMVPLLAKKGRTLTAQMDTQVSVNGERFGPRRVYLFSDALVVVQRVRKEKKTKKKFVYVCQLLFESASVSDVKDGTTESGKQVKACLAIEDGKNKVLMCCNSDLEKLEWLDHISKGIELAKSLASLNKKGTTIQDTIRNAKSGEKPATSAVAAILDLKSTNEGGKGERVVTLFPASADLGEPGSPSVERDGSTANSSLSDSTPELSPSSERIAAASADNSEAAVEPDDPMESTGPAAELTPAEKRKKKRSTVYLGSLTLPRFGTTEEGAVKEKKDKKKKKKKIKETGNDKTESKERKNSASSPSLKADTSKN